MPNLQCEFSFNERLIMSAGVSASPDVADILLQNIPGALQVRKAHETNDRAGTDLWVEMAHGRFLAIDTKIRETDWLAQHPDEDDLALETWSVDRRVIGWTRDPNKRTDYILWYWEDTGRWCLVPFQLLCAVFTEHWREWSQTYRTAVQGTSAAWGRWKSQCVFVPRAEVWRAIYRRYGGSLTVKDAC